MAVDYSARKLTYADYEQIPNDGMRHEIIDGIHYVTPAPARRHQYFLARLTARLFTFAEERRLGQVYAAPFDVLFSDYDIVQPDLVFVSNERLGVLNDKNAQGAPDLVVEVLSPSTRRRDQTIKRRLYERDGVQEYWVVDPERGTVAVHRRSGTGFAKAMELAAAAGDRLETPLLPGFALPLRDLFAEP
jgi:Uma2 family endonuclease